MFHIWKHESSSGSPGLQRSIAFDPVTAKTAGHQACFNCRARKVKCTSHPRGCERCEMLGQECRYPATHRRAFKHSRKPSKDDGSESSNDKGSADESSAGAAAEMPPTGLAYSNSQRGRTSPVIMKQKGSDSNKSLSSSLKAHAQAQAEQDPCASTINLPPECISMDAFWDPMTISIEDTMNLGECTFSVPTDVDPSLVCAGVDPLGGPLLGTGTSTLSPAELLFSPLENGDNPFSLALGPSMKEDWREILAPEPESRTSTLPESDLSLISSSPGGNTSCWCL
ncbi:hypothetical protein F5X99DRAFT_123584 [Biscogniauxia marginata]|nr:hypothetical protein F5X99DRAFT_123584 [Biscogniauxia marginata]